MSKAYLFPGQGAQFSGMGHALYQKNKEVQKLFQEADELLGFSISDIMFHGTDEDLKQTRVTQPAVFLHSVSLAKALGETFTPQMVAGHSLGEFSALVAAEALSFQSGLTLVAKRAGAMQKACEMQPSTMAAILGLPDEKVISVCESIQDHVVVAANFNSPGQVVISGDIQGVTTACDLLKQAGAKRALPLRVGGAFHSPLMEPAREELAQAIEATSFTKPICPIYQNVTGKAYQDPQEIKANLVAQLTSPVRWTQTIQNMIADGATDFTELGPGSVLKGLLGRIAPEATAQSLDTIE